RPASTFFFGLLAMILIPIIMLILSATGIGLLVVPLLLAAQVIGMVFGKVAILEFIGQKIGRAVGASFLQKPAVAFLLGTVLITLLYVVPIIGLLTWC